MRWFDWLLVLIAVGAVVALIVFFGSICDFRPPYCGNLHYQTEGFVAFGLAVAATLLFAGRRFIGRRR